MKTIDIKGKQYVEVNERLKEFRTNKKYENFSLESEIIELNNGICTIKAVIKDSNGVIKATGFAQEKENSSFINKTSYIENCETSAWGRALGNLGIGIDTNIATAEEVKNAILNQENTSESNFSEEYNNELDAAIAEEQNKLTCADCGAILTRVVHDYSCNKFGKPLCMACQKKNKKLVK